MAKYEVTKTAARLEINGKEYKTGDILSESDFAEQTREQKKDGAPTELDSLLESKHVKKI